MPPVATSPLVLIVDPFVDARDMYAEYLEFRQKSRVFAEDIGGGNEDVLWTSDQGTEQLDGA